MNTISATETVTAASIITLVQGVERVGSSAPAAIAFKAALHRKGTEADTIGGLAALEALADAVVAADPNRADTRTAILRAAWADLLPGPNGRRRL